MVFLYEKGKQGIRILRVFGETEEVPLPDKIEELPVTELGDYIFSDKMDKRELEAAKARGLYFSDGFSADENLPEVCGEGIREVALPRYLKRIGRYAFYNCKKLNKLSFYGELTDIGAGAFTGCHRIGHLEVEIAQQEKTCLRELLMELPEEMRVDYRKGALEGRFWFPEFFEEGVENTPARILETHVHGSGMRYRNCFQEKELNIREYDRQFYYAETGEREELAVELALGRLLYPMELSEKAAKSYQVYLREHFLKMAELLTKRRDYRSFGSLLKLVEPSAESVEALLEKAGSSGETEVISLLMDYRHGKVKPRRKVFEL